MIKMGACLRLIARPQDMTFRPLCSPSPQRFAFGVLIVRRRYQCTSYTYIESWDESKFIRGSPPTGPSRAAALAALKGKLNNTAAPHPYLIKEKKVR